MSDGKPAEEEEDDAILTTGPCVHIWIGAEGLVLGFEKADAWSVLLTLNDELESTQEANRVVVHTFLW